MSASGTKRPEAARERTAMSDERMFAFKEMQEGLSNQTFLFVHLLTGRLKILITFLA